MIFPSAETARFASVSGAFLLAFPALFSIVNPLGASLIFAEVTHGRSAAERAMLARKVALFPLTMPFTVGPGSISVAIALGAERPDAAGVLNQLGFTVGACLAAVAVCAIVWIAYSGAPRLVRLLGRSGARIVTRLVALILLCIGVQIVVSGVQDVLAGAVAQAFGGRLSPPLPTGPSPHG